MITKDNFKALLLSLHFQQHGNQFSKVVNNIHLAVDFDKNELLYPNGLIIHERQTCNFSASENFVVFECVHRLLEKGYAPDSIELEPKWKLGHGASGGRADILVKDRENKPLLIIECKTAGTEYKKAIKYTQFDGGQLFSYAQQIPATQFLCLYASDFSDKKLTRDYIVISHIDNDKIALKDGELNRFDSAQSVIERFDVWKNTYQLELLPSVIFEDKSQAYIIGKDKYTLADLKVVDARDKEGKYHQFRTILRKYNVARRENAFEVLVNLFLCKIVDETQNNKLDTEHQELKFYWKGIAYDSYFDLVDRLQSLYQTGMDKFLNQDVIYISNEEIDNAFWAVKNDKNATKKRIKELFTQLKFYKGLDFDFIKVHNKNLFEKNAKVLIEIVQMWQDSRLTTHEQNQFLGDMFEYFLDNGIKQSEGQFFTPMPICRFILMSLPLEELIQQSEYAPKVIDYACGAGHFLNEYAAQIKPLLTDDKHFALNDCYAEIVGIEKEDRLAKVAKVSAFMYGQDAIKIIDADALATHEKLKADSFNLLVANPPFAVEGFLETLEEDRENYTLLNTVSDVINNRNIQCFFIERAKQLLAPNGIAAIIVPSSVLSNSDATHVGSREILLQCFDIVAIVELGSGTFGKTGTNTVVLFLRRKHKQPIEAEQYFNRVNDWFNDDKEEDVYEDSSFIHRYCQHNGIDFEQYQTLLNGKPSAELLTHELFIDYANDFNNSADIKNLHKQKSFKDKSALEKQNELNKRFLSYLQRIEKDKLYYFVLASVNPQKVLIVKSPSDGKEQKAFLGYEWSAAKGNEGIKLTTDNEGNHVTPLYDVANRDNPEKINTLIAQNFLGKALDLNLLGLKDLAGLVTQTRLVDMLDFSRKDFNKTISLTAKKSLIVETKWDLVKLGEVSEVIAGQSPESEYYNEEKKGLAFYQGKKDFGKIYLNNPAVWTTKITKESIKSDILMSVRAPVGDVNINPFEKICIGRGLAVIRSNNSDLRKYLFEFINQNQFLFKGNKGTTFDSISTDDLRQIKIPFPPTDIQQKIVSECEAIDTAVQDAEKTINNAWQEIDDKLNLIFAENYPVKKLSAVIEIIGGGTPSTKNPEFWNGDIPWLSVVDFNNKQRFVSTSEKTISELGLKNSSTKYLNIGDLIISARGTVGALAQLAIPMTFNQSCYGLRGNEEMDNGFLYYVLKREINQFKDNAYGSTFGSITTRTFDSIRIPIPPVDIQKNILIDIEKIENKISTAQKTINEAASKKQAVLKQYL
ncbi:MAG: restriction endonuclease subunit S [Methylococcales bacterium]|nr:restriction endonuclease subunit S [Methylococcales bacterium]